MVGSTGDGVGEGEGLHGLDDEVGSTRWAPGITFTKSSGELHVELHEEKLHGELGKTRPGVVGLDTVWLVSGRLSLIEVQVLTFRY